MGVLEKSLDRAAAVAGTAHATALRLKGAGLLSSFSAPGMSTTPSDWQQQSKNRESYAQFRSWTYSAIHALAGAIAGQPINVGRIEGMEEAEEEMKRLPGGVKALGRKADAAFRRRSPRAWKAYRARLRDRLKRFGPYLRKSMPKGVKSAYDRVKSSGQELELIADHPLLKLFDKPNPMQHKFQFVYTAVANLCLTGRCYIFRDEGKDGMELYCVPTNWVHVDKSKPKWTYRVANPTNYEARMNAEPIPAENVVTLYLPNPADPLSCYSPATSQSAAIRIDDRIQTCEEKHFDNGVFPSMVIKIGTNPMGTFNKSAGLPVRPRLTPAQLRQVMGAVRRVHGSVSNYNLPMIVDGLIESVEPFGRGINELGWDKSEDKIRDRILCAFGVHPFMIGQALNVGGYAQAANIEKVFCRRANTYIDLLSTAFTEFCGEAEGVLVWWEELEAVDKSLENQQWDNARARNDVSQNEHRAYMGLPPDEDGNEQLLNSTEAASVAAIIGQVGAGSTRPEQAEWFFRAMGLPDDYAEGMAGTNLPPEEDESGLFDDEGEGGEYQFPPGAGAEDEAVEALQEAVAALRIGPAEYAGKLLEVARGQ